jgi:hypothetical protein
MDFIQEVQMKTSGLEAEYGGALGGVVNVIMEKGTNHWHGSVFSSFQNEAMNGSPTATSRYDPSSSGIATSWGAVDPTYQNYQPIRPKTSDVFPGLTLGGPLLDLFPKIIADPLSHRLRDRLFLFMAFNPEFNAYEEFLNYGPNGGVIPFSQNTHTMYSNARLDAEVTQRIRVFGSWLSQGQREYGESLPTSDSVQGYFNTVTGCSGTGASLTCTGQFVAPSTYAHTLGYSAPNTTLNTGADITISNSLVSTTRFGYYFENYSSVPCTGDTPLLDLFQPGLGKKVNKPNKNIGPMVGLTYSPGANGKTVLRGGFGVYYDSNIWNNILFDRENRLQKGLFNQYTLIHCTTSPSLAFPGGTVVNSVDGVPLTSVCSEPLSQSAPYVVDLQKQYQAAVAAAGPSANPAFVGETLSIPSSFYAPNYVSPYSLQFNGGIQRELRTGTVLSVDYVHSATLKIQQTIDVNHVGAARYLNTTAAQNAIAATLAGCGVASIQDAIAACPGLETQSDGTVLGATIDDFMSNGLDSGNNFLSGNSALYGGGTTATGAAFGGANPNLGVGLFNFPSGRAGYDALQVNLRQQSNHPLPGIAHSNFEASYALSRITTTSRGGSNAFFTNSPWDYDDATRCMGPANLDTLHSLSFGGAFQIQHGPEIGLIAHFRSSNPSDLTLDNTFENNIFQTDVDGDGQTGDLLPGTNPGSYERTIKPGDLKKAITNYNAAYAGQLTPAGQALVSSGLFTSQQLTQLNAVQQPIYNNSTHIFANPAYQSLDASFSYPIKLKFISETANLQPKIAIYNVANYANWTGATGTLINTTNAGTDGSGALSYVNGTNGFDLKSQNRVQRGTGTFDQGGPRSMEFQMWFNF